MQYRFKPLQWIRKIKTGKKPELSLSDIKDGFATLMSDGKETKVRLKVFSEEQFRRLKEIEKELIEKINNP